MLVSKWKTVIILAITLLSITSHAQDGLYFSAFGGVANTDLNGFGTKFTYGFHGGFRLGERLTTGLYYQVYSTHTSNSIGGADIYIVPLLIEANFHFIKASDGPYVGLKMGGIRHSADNVTGNYTPPINAENDFSIGICGGYNLEMVEGQSFGVELDSFNTDAKPSQYSFFSLVASYTLNF